MLGEDIRMVQNVDNPLAVASGFRKRYSKARAEDQKKVSEIA
jgi:hypothetical protein